jgi:hypothetical protein
MNNSVRTLATVSLGITTSILAVFANLIGERVTGHNFYSISIWFILPVGSAFLGAAAASGFYYGSAILKQRVGWPFLIIMLVTAAFSVLLMYWINYKFATVAEGRLYLSDLISFPAYLDKLLTTNHLQVFGRGGSSADTGEVGSFGYWNAAILAIGFLLSYLFFYFLIRDKASCPSCQTYTKPLGTREKLFTGPIGATAYYDELAKQAAGSAEFTDLLLAKGNSERLELGAVKIKISLLCCPMCQMQQLQENLYQYQDSKWLRMNGDTPVMTQLPAGVDLEPVFRK